MLARTPALVLAALGASTCVAALPSSFGDLVHWARGDAPNQCTSGSLHCCKSIQDRNSKTAQWTAIPLGLGEKLRVSDGSVGLECVAIEVGGSCSTKPVCCEHLSIGGIIAIGCDSA